MPKTWLLVDTRHMVMFQLLSSPCPTLGDHSEELAGTCLWHSAIPDENPPSSPRSTHCTSSGGSPGAGSSFLVISVQCCAGSFWIFLFAPPPSPYTHASLSLPGAVSTTNGAFLCSHLLSPPHALLSQAPNFPPIPGGGTNFLPCAPRLCPTPPCSPGFTSQLRALPERPRLDSFQILLQQSQNQKLPSVGLLQARFSVYGPYPSPNLCGCLPTAQTRYLRSSKLEPSDISAEWPLDHIT